MSAMVTLVWGGGEGVLGEGSPPPWFLIILKKPCPPSPPPGAELVKGALEVSSVRCGAVDAAVMGPASDSVESGPC